MAETGVPEVSDEAGLYEVAPDHFVAARDGLVRRLRSSGDKAGAARVAKLRKPTLSVWVLNRLAATAPELVEALLAAGLELHSAMQRALDGDASGLRLARDEERRAVDGVISAGVDDLEAAGYTAKEAVRQRMAATLRAAIVDDAVASQLRRGALDRDHDAPGFGLDAVSAPLALVRSLDRPKTPPAGRPDAPVGTRSDAPPVGRSDAPPAGRPGAPVGGRREAPVVGRPKAPVDGRPDAPLAGRPDAPPGGRPYAPLAGRPDAPPDAPVGGRPDAPLDAPLAGRPDAPLAGRPTEPGRAPKEDRPSSEEGHGVDLEVAHAAALASAGDEAREAARHAARLEAEANELVAQAERLAAEARDAQDRAARAQQAAQAGRAEADRLTAALQALEAAPNGVRPDAG